MLRVLMLTAVSLIRSRCEVVSNQGNLSTFYGTLLFQAQNQSDTVHALTSPFPITFQNTSYTQLYFSSNSYVTFGAFESGLQHTPENMTSPKILISGGSNYATLIEVSSTMDNITLHYKGTSVGSLIQWRLIFYNLPFERFDLIILQNNLTTGTSAICNQSSCYQALDIAQISTKRYELCPIGSCLSYERLMCLSTGLDRCGVCTTADEKCQKCSFGFYLNDKKDQCTNCSVGYVSGDTCYVIAFCVQYDADNPTRCSQCSGLHTGNQCEVYNLSGGVIAGIVGGAIALVAIFVCLFKMKRRNQLSEQGVAQYPSESILPELSASIPDSIKPHFEDDCTICLQGKGQAMVECGHQFHGACLLEWIRRDSKCPNCNHRLSNLSPYAARCSNCQRRVAIVSLVELMDSQYYCKQCRQTKRKNSTTCTIAL